MADDANKPNEETTDKKPANAKPVKVKFLKPHTLYNKGEVATFPSAKADWLLEKKIAIKA